MAQKTAISITLDNGIKMKFGNEILMNIYIADNNIYSYSVN